MLRPQKGNSRVLFNDTPEFPFLGSQYLCRFLFKIRKNREYE